MTKRNSFNIFYCCRALLPFTIGKILYIITTNWDCARQVENIQIIGFLPCGTISYINEQANRLWRLKNYRRLKNGIKRNLQNYI